MKRRGGCKNKKGLSTIVATLIIVLLVLVAVVILWVVLRNFISSGAEQISLGKLTLNMEIKKVNQIDDSNLNVTVRRNAGAGNFTGINFVIYGADGGDNEVVRVSGASMNELEERTFSLILAELNASEISKVEIVPIFTLESGKEVIGDVKDTLEISEGSSGGSSCTDTCSSLGYECGTQSICDVNVNCGSCTGGEVCNGVGICVTTCTDTCSSLGYECGTQTVCEVSTNCGSCGSGQTCSSGSCVSSGTLDVSSIGGLVSWWRLDGDFSDETGTYNAQQAGTVNSVTGQFGQAYQFGSGGYIRTIDSVGGDANLKGDLSYSFWIKRNGLPTSPSYGRYFGGSGLSTNLGTGGMASGYFVTNGLFYMDTYNSTNRTALTTPASAIFDGSWHHVVFTRDTAGNSVIYLDGGSVANSATTVIGNLAWCPNDRFVIGVSYCSCGAYDTSHNFEGGAFDEFMIFSKELTPSEVQSLYSATEYV